MNPRAEILSAPSPAARIRLSPRLDQQQRPSTLSAAEPARQCIEREPHRDFRKLVDWPKADHAAARAIGLDVRVALGCELLEGGVKGVHATLLLLVLSLFAFWRRCFSCLRLLGRSVACRPDQLVFSIVLFV